MPYVYMLGDHDEDGSDNLIATLDRSKLPDMATKWGDEARQGLIDLLKKPDEELAGSGIPCQGGWGGMLLHVVKLD